MVMCETVLRRWGVSSRSGMHAVVSVCNREHTQIYLSSFPLGSTKRSKTCHRPPRSGMSVRAIASSTYAPVTQGMGVGMSGAHTEE